MMIMSRNSRSGAGSCQMKIFKSDNTNDSFNAMRSCKSPVVDYKHIITSTNNPTISSKMKYSQYIQNRKCVPSNLHIR